MKRNLSFKLFGLFTVLTVVLVLIGIDFVEGRVNNQGKPPIQPGKGKKGNYTWSAVVLDDLGFGLKGIEGIRYDASWPGWVYNDSESNVNVGVEIRRAPYDGVDKYWTRFYLEIFYPIQVDFEFIPYNAWFYPNTPDALCKYPGPYVETEPFSMFDFLFSEFHPHPEYEKVLFRFNTDRSINQNDIDYTMWVDDYHSHMGFSTRVFGHDPFLFKPENCEELNLFEFSSIEFGGGDYGYFERLGENIWKVYVGAERNGYEYITQSGEEDDAWATDWYHTCVLTQINKKKTSATYDATFSSQGSFDMKFAILFVRTMQ
jgi:hypothetical protein